MKNNNKLTSYFIRHWHYYVIWLIIVLFVWEMIFTTIAAPKKDKTIQFFIAAFEVDDVSIQKKLDEKRPDYLRNLNIYKISPALPQFYTLFETHGLINSDVLILPEKVYTEGDFYTEFASVIDKAYLSRYFADVEYLEKDGKAYGIKVYDKSTEKGVADSLISFSHNNYEKEDYYMFFNKRSLHAGELTGGDYDGALKLAAELMELD